MKKFNNINIHFAILFNIAICAVFIDILVFFLKLPYEISLAISSFIIISINIFLIKKKILNYSSNFQLLDLFFIFFILLTTLKNIAIPDFSYDVKNYHIYLQENILIDKVNFDFFAGRTVNGFLFALGDRMHYIFRFLLGYRLGTILSYYSIIVIYYQTKNILNTLCKSKKANSILAILCISSYIIRQWLGTYYIDLLSTAFILEIVYFLIKEEKCFEETNKLYTLALLIGLATAIKLPNILLIAPIIIFFIPKRFKQLNFKKIPNYIICLLIFALPFIVYLIDNIQQTGSPLYPYYNNIFKSDLFGYYSWKDPYFGIPNFLYMLIWPVYTSCIKLGYADSFYITDYIWAIGYITTIIYIIYCVIRRKIKNNKLFSLALLSLILTFTWILLLEGYMRYALIIPVLYSILIATLLNKLIYKIYNKYFKTINKKYLNIFFFVITIYYLIIYTIMIFNVSNIQFIKNNYSLILKDRKTTIHIDGVWGVIGDDSALTELVREENVPIYNLQKEYFTSSEKLLDLYNKNLTQNTDIYMLIPNKYFNEKITYLIKNNLTGTCIQVFDSSEIPYINANDTVGLYKITPLNK